MGSKGGSSTTVQKADPWAGQQPYLLEVFKEAQDMYQSGALAPDYYPEQTVAPESEWTRQARAMQAQRALEGSASVRKAQEAMDAVVGGSALANSTGLGVLNGMAGTVPGAGSQGLAALEQMTEARNPYMDALYADAAGETAARIDSGFSGAGRYGSGAHANARADGLADLASQMYAHAYDRQGEAAAQAGSLYQQAVDSRLQAAQAAGQLHNAGVGQQVLAAGAAQSLADQTYKDAAALSEAGAAQDAYLQQLINAEIDRWNYQQQAPIAALNAYQQLVSGNYGGTTTTTGQKTASAKDTLGTMVAGASLGTSLGGFPGTVLGALGGGLLSLF